MTRRCHGPHGLSCWWVSSSLVEIIPALELVAEAGDGAAAHGGVLVGGVGGAAVGLAVADPALRDALAALLAAEVALPVIISDNSINSDYD